MSVTFQQINQEKREIQFGQKTKSNFAPVYLSIVTNGYTRILRFDNLPPPRSTLATQKLLKAEEEQEKKAQAEMQKVLKFHTFIKMVNISVCSPGKELMTLYLKGISANLSKTQKKTSFEFNL